MHIRATFILICSSALMLSGCASETSSMSPDSNYVKQQNEGPWDSVVTIDSVVVEENRLIVAVRYTGGTNADLFYPEEADVGTGDGRVSLKVIQNADGFPEASPVLPGEYVVRLDLGDKPVIAKLYFPVPGIKLKKINVHIPDVDEFYDVPIIWKQ